MTVNNGSSTPGSNTTIPSNTEDANKQISSLNLEPNPFEQSFASTKKPFDPISNTSNSSGVLSTAGSPSSLLNLANGKQNMQRNNSISTQRSFHRGSIPNGISNLPMGSNPSSTNLLFSGGQRPVIHSPPMLTPGGSKRLPPLISPNYGSTLQQQQTQQPQQTQTQMSPDTGMVGTTLGTTTALNSNNNSSTLISSLINNGTMTTKPNGTPGPGTPSFLSYLPRSGLTPNESSIRSGLTPGALTAPFNYPMLPALSTNGATGTVTNTNGGSVIRPNQPLTPGMSAIFNNVAAPITSNSKLITNVDGLVNNVKHNDNNNKNNGDTKNNKKGSTTRRKRANSTKSETNTKNKKQLKNEKKGKAKNDQKDKPASKVQPEIQDNNDHAMTKDLENEEPLDPEQEEQKRKEFLERNRVAASKFRKRKKEYIKKIEEDLNFYENEYNEMSNTLFKLLPPTDTGSHNHNSYIPMLEDSIRKNDINSALALLSHVRQLLTETKIYQRKGENPLGNDLQMIKENTKKQVTSSKDSMSKSQHQQHVSAGIPSSMSPSSMSSYLPTGMTSQVSLIHNNNSTSSSSSSVNDKNNK
ncbi:hypothetical protein C6P45_003997 [Maudiozyma exigua]|uniref:BZIP domain-containing protein n=1 Tax=Maudiozyma exigua TaxID=34358 RepID=A0A9P7BA45_MAUEX|nr:hypothetical protein C6P45_003997 [Kazachstania exigua]